MRAQLSSPSFLLRRSYDCFPPCAPGRGSRPNTFRALELGCGAVFFLWYDPPVVLFFYHHRAPFFAGFCCMQLFGGGAPFSPHSQACVIFYAVRVFPLSFCCGDRGAMFFPLLTSSCENCCVHARAQKSFNCLALLTVAPFFGPRARHFFAPAREMPFALPLALTAVLFITTILSARVFNLLTLRRIQRAMIFQHAFFSPLAPGQLIPGIYLEHDALWQLLSLLRLSVVLESGSVLFDWRCLAPPTLFQWFSLCVAFADRPLSCQTPRAFIPGSALPLLARPQT